MTILLWITAYLGWGLLMALAIIWILGRITGRPVDKPGHFAVVSMIAWPILWPVLGVVAIYSAVAEAWMEWWENWEKRSRGKGGRK